MTDVAELERIGFAAWPSLEHEVLHGWIARAAGGITRRANSISPIGAPTVPLEEAIEAGSRWLTGRCLRTVFRLTPLTPSNVEPALRRRGLVDSEGALIMTRPLAPAAMPPSIEIERSASSEFTQLLAGSERREQEVLEAMFEAQALPCWFAAARIDDGIVAIGMAVQADSYAAIFNMRTAPEVRRRGHARAILAALLETCRRNGSTDGFLQVMPSNAAAVALYEADGFEARYEYRYLQTP